MEINSVVDSGTTVLLRLPFASPPDWLVPELIFTALSKIVVVDDDFSIGQAWGRRFSSKDLPMKPAGFSYFEDTESFRKWFRSQPRNSLDYLFLIDLEIHGSRESGLSLIEDLKLGDSSVLVTSRYDEDSILNTCRRLGLKILPKIMLADIAMSIRNAPNEAQDTSRLISQFEPAVLQV